MKLLVDAHCFDYKTTEGINTYLSGLYVALLKQAPDVEFYFMAANIEKVKSIFGRGENIHYIELTSKNKIYRLLFEVPYIIHKPTRLARFFYKKLRFLAAFGAIGPKEGSRCAAFVRSAKN